MTWYDNLDRVRFVAEYEGDGPSGTAVDPRDASPGDTEPAAGDILSTIPLSLTENIHNPRGQVQEVRRYAIDPNDPGFPDESAYTSTITYYDHRTKPIEVHSANSPVQKYVYDAKGRQVASSSFAAGIEVTRTETEFDDNDRAIVTTHYERVHGTVGALDDNCVKTYTHTWYDKAGKVIATANFGTNNSTFSSGSAPTYDPSGPPDGSGGELVTEYEYDDAGRQSAVWHPDDTVTRYEYDGLGRLLLTTENADDADRSLVRRTAYAYHPDTGQLTHMAAVLPAHGDIASWDQINWGATDGSLEITEFDYAAAVVDSGLETISANNSWISEVYYPDRDTGQPDTNQKLTFSYYSDGALAMRTDARGILFTHTYDEQGRRVTTEVEDTAWFDPNDPLVPVYRINRIDYTYTPDSMLELATDRFTRNPGPESARGCSFYREDLQRPTAGAGPVGSSRERVSGSVRGSRGLGDLLAAALSVSLVITPSGKHWTLSFRAQRGICL